VALRVFGPENPSGVENNKNGSINFAGFDVIINAHNVDLFVVGLPFNKDGKEQEMTFIAKSFGRKFF
jgi:putative Holliday junction resolvase